MEVHEKVMECLNFNRFIKVWKMRSRGDRLASIIFLQLMPEHLKPDMGRHTDVKMFTGVCLSTVVEWLLSCECLVTLEGKLWQIRPKTYLTDSSFNRKIPKW